MKDKNLKDPFDFVEVVLCGNKEELDKFFCGKKKKKLVFEKEKVLLSLEIRGFIQANKLKSGEEFLSYIQEQEMAHFLTEEHYLEMVAFLNDYPDLVDYFVLEKA